MPECFKQNPMIFRCSNCHIYIDQASAYCFNCGTEKPNEPSMVSLRTDHTFSFSVVGAVIFALIVAAITGWITYQDDPGSLWRNMGCSVVPGLLLGFLFSMMGAPLVQNKLTRAAYRKQNVNKAIETLTLREDRLYEKRAEMADRDNYSGFAYGEYEPHEYETLHFADDIGISATILQTNPIDLLVDEINLLRIGNNIHHIQKQFDSLSAEETQECIAAARAAKKELAGMISESDRADFTSLVTSAEVPGELSKNSCLTFSVRKTEVNEAVQRLRDALRRRLNSLESGMVPLNEGLSFFSDSEKYASEATVATFDSISTDYDEMLVTIYRRSRMIGPENQNDNEI